jgi:hypothetical protein
LIGSVRLLSNQQPVSPLSSRSALANWEAVNCSNVCLNPRYCEQGVGDLKDGNLGVSNGALKSFEHGSIERAASQYKSTSWVWVLTAQGIKGKEKNFLNSFWILKLFEELL